MSLGGSGGGLGVQGVGLAASAPGLSVGAVDLDHHLAVAVEEARQPSPKLPVPSIPQALIGPRRRAQPSSSA